eukprot:SAG22_NODE_15427_length_349_cov_0.620000_1_plen_61_part_10
MMPAAVLCVCRTPEFLHHPNAAVRGLVDKLQPMRAEAEAAAAKLTWSSLLDEEDGEFDTER